MQTKMPKITVELASPLSNQVKWRKRDFEAATVHQVVSLLHSAFPAELRDTYFDPSPIAPKSFILFLLNGQDIRWKKGFDTQLKDGDLLQVAIALGGG